MPRFNINYTLDQRLYVIWLRFGSLTEEGKPRMPYRRIFEISGVKPVAAFRIVRRWRENGYKVLPSMKGTHPRKVWYTPDIKAFLLDPTTLRAWAPYSLQGRLILLKERFPEVKIVHRTLCQFYHDHGIRYRKPQYRYHRKEEKMETLLLD